MTLMLVTGAHIMRHFPELFNPRTRVMGKGTFVLFVIVSMIELLSKLTCMGCGIRNKSVRCAVVVCMAPG